MKHAAAPFRLVLITTVLSAAPLALAGEADHAAYEIESGRVVIAFHEANLQAAGLQVRDLDETADLLSPVGLESMESAPIMFAFGLAEDSDLRYLRFPEGHFVPYGILDGSASITGGFSLWSPSTARGVDFHEFRMHPQPVLNDGPGGEPDPDYFFITTRDELTGKDLKLCYVKVMSGGPELLTGYSPGGDHDVPVMIIKAWDLIVTEELADKLRRPDLVGVTIGTGKLETLAVESSEPYTYPRGQNPDTPYQGGGAPAGDGGEPVDPSVDPIPAGSPIAGLDVRLGILSSITALGHTGTYPNGHAGLSMSTTSCNVGSVDVTWLAAMNENHPGIDMWLFREKDVLDAGSGTTYSRFEQVGRSWIKHGFFALSNSQCTPCQHPSGGSFLGVGCSDTYGTSNNGDRMWLGPREEWDVFENTWTAFGSYFDGTPVDGVRSNFGSGLGSVLHRTEVHDSELGDSASNYYYGAMYLVKGDTDIRNNVATLRCASTWNGFGWSMSTPAFPPNFQVNEQPLSRWGDLGTPPTLAGQMQSVAGLGTDDGNVVLAVQVTDLQNGQYRYEYVLWNWNLERRIREFSVPNCGVSTNQFFRDSNNENPANDWVVTALNGNVNWTFNDVFSPGDHKETGPLDFGTAYNFGFTSLQPPVQRQANLRLHDAGPGGDLMLVDTLAPSCLNLSANASSPKVGENLDLIMRGGTLSAWMVLLAVNDVPLVSPIIIPPAPFPFVGGTATASFTVPAPASGVEIDIIGAEVNTTPPILPTGFTNVFKVKIQ